MRVLEKTTENSEWLNQQVRPGIEPGASHPPVLERRIAQPQVEPRTDHLTTMPYPGFEPGTFGAAAGFSNHCTTWSSRWERESQVNNYF